ALSKERSSAQVCDGPHRRRRAARPAIDAVHSGGDAARRVQRVQRTCVIASDHSASFDRRAAA
ncbi:MAG TPA: hypothetical protein VGD80_04675, partial [Kofleriaceae bacterium]